MTTNKGSGQSNVFRKVTWIVVYVALLTIFAITVYNVASLVMARREETQFEITHRELAETIRQDVQKNAARLDRIEALLHSLHAGQGQACPDLNWPKWPEEWPEIEDPELEDPNSWIWPVPSDKT